MSEEIKNSDAELPAESFDQLDPDDLDSVSGGVAGTPRTCTGTYCRDSYTTASITIEEL